MHTILLNASATSLYGSQCSSCECDFTLWQPVDQPTQWTCMSITQVKCDMQTVLNNSVASYPRMNRKKFLGGGPDSPDPTHCEA